MTLFPYFARCSPPQSGNVDPALPSSSSSSFLDNICKAAAAAVAAVEELKTAAVVFAAAAAVPDVTLWRWRRRLRSSISPNLLRVAVGASI